MVLSQKKIFIQNKKNESNLKKTFVFWLFFAGGLIMLAEICSEFFFQLAKGHGFFRIEPLYNRDFAFSLALPVWLIYLIYAMVLVGMFLHIGTNWKRFNKIEMSAWVFIVSGAIFNIGERIMSGQVRDYLYILGGVFNIADLYIIIGILILVYLNTFYDRKNSFRSGSGA